MEVEQPQEKNHKCPYCALSCNDLDRFKQHLINCRKCNDMDVFVCRHYFGHVFPKQADLESHYPLCIFNKAPVRYIENKRIRLGKSAKEQIMNEYFPIPLPQTYHEPQSHRNHHPAIKNQYAHDNLPPVMSHTNNNNKNYSRTNNRSTIEPIRNDDQEVFHYYVFQDLPSDKTFNLMYSFGLDLSINTLVTFEHKEVKEYSAFFKEETFDEEQFKKYSSLYTLFIPENEGQLFSYFRKTLGNKIAINDSKKDSHNEILIAATSDSEVIGKFVWTEIAFLIVPASLLLDYASKPTESSFYKKSTRRQDKDKNHDLTKVEMDRKKNFKDRLTQDVNEAKLTNLHFWMNELQATPVSIVELQELVQTLEVIQDELENKKKEERYQRNKEMEAIKNKIQDSRKFNNELEHAINQKEKKIQQMEETLERDKNIAKAKFDRAIKNKIDECDQVYLNKKTDIEADISINSATQLRHEARLADLRLEVDELKPTLDESRKSIEESTKKIKGLEVELRELTIKEKDTLKDLFKGSGLGAGAPKLSDFNCNNCKTRNKDVVFLPCRHMLRCKECCGSLKEDVSKCGECGLVIQKIMDVMKIEYKLPFDELLGNK